MTCLGLEHLLREGFPNFHYVLKKKKSLGLELTIIYELVYLSIYRSHVKVMGALGRVWMTSM